MIDDPEQTWIDECERAKRSVDCHFELRGDYCIEAAERLLAVAHRLKGVACTGCGGVGRKSYPSTATWAGGIGGQAVTDGICDKCWGTGRTDRTGADLRRIRARLAVAERVIEKGKRLSEAKR